MAILFNNTVVQKAVLHWPFYSASSVPAAKCSKAPDLPKSSACDARPIPALVIVCLHGPFQYWSLSFCTAHSSPGHGLSARPIPALVMVCLHGPFQPWSSSVCTAHSSPGHCPHGPFQPWSLSRPIPALVIIWLHGLDTLRFARHASTAGGRQLRAEGDGHR